MVDLPPDRVLVLDLDGTVLVGDDPVRAYLRSLPQGRLRSDAAARLERHLADGLGAADGYSFVAQLAREGGIGAAERGLAYAASRAALHRGDLAAGTAPGLAALLDRRPAGTLVALVTNAPLADAGPLLDRIGLAGRFDRLVGDAGKPAGMPAVLRDLLGPGPVGRDRLLAVGDVWANDLEAAAALGGTTALVDRHGLAAGPADVRAPSLAALLPAIEAWLRPDG